MRYSFSSLKTMPRFEGKVPQWKNSDIIDSTLKAKSHLHVIRHQSVTCNRIITMSTGSRFRVLNHDQNDRHTMSVYGLYCCHERCVIQSPRSYVTTLAANCNFRVSVIWGGGALSYNNMRHVPMKRPHIFKQILHLMTPFFTSQHPMTPFYHY